MDRSDFPTTVDELRKHSTYGPILFPPDGNGAIDLNALAREIGDLMMVKRTADEVVQEITGGTLGGICSLGGSVYFARSILEAVADYDSRLASEEQEA